MRRLKFRRRLRKYHTLKVLIENGMCPLSMDELKAWIRKSIFPVENKAFIQWMNSTLEKNPYAYRAMAVRQVLGPLEAGRAFYHLALRRGFKSSRKDAGSGDEKDAEQSEFKQKIQLLTQELEKRNNCTAGEFFYELLKQGKKIRRDWRVGRVEHYEPEFRKICAVQKVPAEVEKKLHQAIFFQRQLPRLRPEYQYGPASDRKQRSPQGGTDHLSQARCRQLHHPARDPEEMRKWKRRVNIEGFEEIQKQNVAVNLKIQSKTGSILRYLPECDQIIPRMQFTTSRIADLNRFLCTERRHFFQLSERKPEGQNLFQ